MRLVFKTSLIILATMVLGKVAYASPQHLHDPQTLRAVAVKDMPTIPRGKGKFKFRGWDGPTILVWTYVPTGADTRQMPVLIVMHGTKRDGDRYRDEWSDIAQKKGFIVIAPEFSKRNFNGATGYNLGGVFSKSKDYRKESKWAFSAIEPLFDTVIAALDSTQNEYTLYGHSAGSQFVHRFLFYKPNARVKRYLPANAGWYTMPDMNEKYPYGLSGANVHVEALKQALQKDVFILLGRKDNDPNHKYLRRTPEAMGQGAHRFARGLSFFKRAEQEAKNLGVPFNWKIAIVPGAAHSNAQMAAGVADLIE